jgi:hypothetical protein
VTNSIGCRNCGNTEKFHQEFKPGQGSIFFPLGILTSPHGRYRLEICSTCGLTDWFASNELLDAIRGSVLPEK